MEQYEIFTKVGLIMTIKITHTIGIYVCVNIWVDDV